MAINLSDKLTADHSENYIMSIRLRSGGLSFSAYSPSVNESFFYRDVEFDRTRPYVSSLKECFFENDFLTWFYKPNRRNWYSEWMRMCMSSVPVRLSILVLSIMSVRCFRCGRSRAVRACPASYMSCCIGGGWMWRAMRREICFS